MKTIFFLLSLLFLRLFSVEVSAATHDVLMTNLRYEPAALTINQCDSVVWKNIDASFYGGIFHTTTSGTDCTYDETGWDSGTVPLGHSFQTTFNVPGQYPYFCGIHCLFTAMTGTVIVNPIVMPLPAGQQFISYSPVPFPVSSVDPLQSMPIGIGDLARGGQTLTIQIQTAEFAGPVNLLFAVEYAGLIYILTPTGFQALETAGLVPWMTGVTGCLNVTPFGSIPVSALAKGHYTLFLGVVSTAPAPGSGPFPFYLWWTTALVQ